MKTSSHKAKLGGVPNRGSLYAVAAAYSKEAIEEPGISGMFEPEEKTENMLQLESLWTKNPSMLPR